MKCVFRHLQGTKDYGLMFPRGATLQFATLQLHAYKDSNWASDFDMRHPLVVFLSSLGHLCISWLSKK